VAAYRERTTIDFEIAAPTAERRAHAYVEFRDGADHDTLGPWLHQIDDLSMGVPRFALAMNDKPG
jgi:hypothetical protein